VQLMNMMLRANQGVEHQLAVTVLVGTLQK